MLRRPNGTSARLEKVRLLVDIGNYTDAWAAGSDLLDRESVDVDLVVLRGEIRLALGQFVPALADAKRATGLDELHAPASLLAGALQAAGGQDAAAQQALRTALDLDPCDLDGLARIDILATEQVTAPLRAAIRRRPDDAKLAAVVGITLASSGEVDEARSIVGSALRMDPQRWEVRLAEAFFSAFEGRPEDALRAANVLLAELDCSGVRVVRVLALMAEARLEEALTDLDEALAQWPGSVDLLFARASLHSVRQDWPATLRDASQGALDLRPTHAEIRLLRERARLTLDSPDLALRDVTELLAGDPANAEALTLRAEIRLLRDDTHGALRDAEAAMTAEVTTEPLLVRGLAPLGR